MKKMLVASAALALVGMAAQAAEVTSSNVVGYSKLTVNAGTYSMLGVQFEAVGGGSMKINDLFAEPAEGAYVGGVGMGDSDQLQVWDPSTSGYKQYFFGDWAGEFGAEYDNLWYWESDDVNPTEDTLAPGAAVWFISRGVADAEVAVSGQVVATDTDVTISAGTYTMVANPFPVPLSLADVTVGGTVDWINAGFTGGVGMGDSDQVQVWDPSTSGYKQYFYGDWNGEFGTEYDQQWYWESDDVNPTTDVIPVGGAMWFILRGASDVTVTFPSPL